MICVTLQRLQIDGSRNIEWHIQGRSLIVVPCVTAPSLTVQTALNMSWPTPVKNCFPAPNVTILQLEGLISRGTLAPTLAINLTDAQTAVTSQRVVPNLRITRWPTRTGERPFSCDKCNYKTIRLTNLNDHKSTHLAVKPFKCQHCPYKAALKSALVRHLKRRSKACIKAEFLKEADFLNWLENLVDHILNIANVHL